MEYIENVNSENNESTDFSQLSLALKAYIEARDAFFAKYGKLLPGFQGREAGNSP